MLTDELAFDVVFFFRALLDKVQSLVCVGGKDGEGGGWVREGEGEDR